MGIQPSSRGRGLEHFVQAARFGNRDVAAETRETVVASPLILARGVRTLSEFFDELLLEHCGGWRCTACRRCKRDLPVGPGANVLHDGVAVSVAVRERDKDVEHRCRQRQKAVQVR